MDSTIITCVDGSETAEAAAHKAAHLASKLGTKLHIISAFGPAETRSQSDGVNKAVVNVRAEAERIASESASTLALEYKMLEISWSATEGKPADALVREAERLRSDLIVVGNRRVQGPARILGSVARSVAALAPCDLYVVNTHQR